MRDNEWDIDRRRRDALNLLEEERDVWKALELLHRMRMREAVRNWRKGPEDGVDEPDAARIPSLEELVLEGSQEMSAPGWLIEAKRAVMTVMTVQEVHSEHPAAQPVQCDRKEIPCPQSRGASLHVAQSGQSVLGFQEQGDLPAKQTVQKTAQKVKQH